MSPALQEGFPSQVTGEPEGGRLPGTRMGIPVALGAPLLPTSQLKTTGIKLDRGKSLLNQLF